jgi:DNA-binding NarL/FixJ family response regulator
VSNLRRAILADPHPLWLDAVSAVLDREIDVIAAVNSTAKVVEIAGELEPDLVVTEIAGPSVGEYIREIRRTSPTTRVIVLTSDDAVETIDEALSAGAVAYVVKTALPDDLSVAVRQAFSHSVFLPSSNGSGSAPATDEARPAPGPKEHGLTRREVEILLLVAEGESNAAVAKRLWVTEQTVKFHLSNIYKKLGVANRTEAAHWATQNGLLGSPSVAA